MGIDDFAWKRGKRYGTVIVHLDTHKIIDLLPDREASSVQQWLEKHPEGALVSRDRAEAYADAATWGAPFAQQVADRWHRCKNLGEAIEKFLIREHIQLPQASADDAGPQTEATLQQPLTSFSATPAKQGQTQARLLRKWKRYQRVQELHAQGMSLRKIGEAMGLARHTVRKYFRQPPDPPLPTPRPLRSSLLDPSEDSLLERWSQGCHNAAQLFREFQEKGFRGANTLVRASLGHLRTSTADGQTPRSRKQRTEAISPRELRWLLTREREKLEQDDQTR